MAELSHLQSGWWVTGLVDGEGCFFSSVNFRSKTTSSGNEVPSVWLQTELSVLLRADDVEALEKLQSYFSCGIVSNLRRHDSSKSNGNPYRTFKVRKLEDIISKVIPHFEKFPLQSKKARDFEIWKSIINFHTNELAGSKGWVRRFPEKLEALNGLCTELRLVREYSAILGEDQTHVRAH